MVDIASYITFCYKATLDLRSIDNSHTLTLQKDSSGTAPVLTTTVAVVTQSTAITEIKGQTSGNATIKLTLNLKEVTLKIKNGNGDTLKATGSITTTKTVKPSSHGTVAKALAAEHELLFTTSGGSTLIQNLGTGTVTIGPGTDTSTLNLNAEATSEGKPTNLKLTLEAGKTSTGGVNDKLTLTDKSTLTLSGGITGQLEYSSVGVSGTLTATRIDSVTFDQNELHYTYKIQWIVQSLYNEVSI